MRIAILAESAADEAAVRILTDALLGQATTSVEELPLRSRGWPYIAQILPAIMRHLYYHTDAQALAVVVDSNSSPLFLCDHVDPRAGHPECRLCRMRSIVAHVVSAFRAVPNRAPLRVAVGIAVPAIEAWFLCVGNPTVTERAWLDGLAGKRLPYMKNQLKVWVYGTDRPSLAAEAEHAREHATRLATHLDLLRQRFPVGFGAFADSVRSWLSV